jgi:hypothetical protein
MLHACPAPPSLQCAERVVLWLAVMNNQEPWAEWAEHRLVPHLRNFKPELNKLKSAQKRIERTNARAGQ